jgi:divalent metal cation (Fe/Co/Zn/Cd) transporter
LLRQAMVVVLDIAPDPRLCRRVTNIAREVPKVSGVEKCLGRKMGNEFFIDMHIEVDPKMTVQESHDVAHNVKNAVRQEIPAIRDVLVHIEPERERNR